MYETELTREIKLSLLNSGRIRANKYKNSVFVYKDEVATGLDTNTYVDFAETMINELEYFTTCYEIKVSINDFNSKYGSNFYGNTNFYVISEDIEEYVLNKVNSNCLYTNIGVLVYRVEHEKYYFDEIKDSKFMEDSFITENIRKNLIKNGIYKDGIDINFAKGIFNIFDSLYSKKSYNEENVMLIKNLIGKLMS